MVVGISMVKDEADIIAATVGHMLREVDYVIVADNLSTDGTLQILEGIAASSEGLLAIVIDADPAYRQSAKTTRLARIAGDLGADFVVPFDADEWWYSPFGRIADVLAGIAPQWLVATAELYDHVATAVDPDVANPVERIGWRRRSPAPLRKVACRWRHDLVIEQGNHGAWFEGGATVLEGLLVVRHFPYRSSEQFVRKSKNGAAAYQAAGDDLSPELGKHWRGYGAIAEAQGDEACGDIFRRWFWSPAPTDDPTLIFDPAPARG